MTQTRSLLRITTLMLIVALAGTFVVLSAQTKSAQTNITDNSTDLVFHKFHPAVPPQTQAAQAKAAPGTISQNALAQIQALTNEKKTRTATQRKIDFNVLATARMLQGRPVVDGVPTLETFVDLDVNNNIVVDITAHVSDTLLDQVRSLGAKVIGSWPEYRQFRAIIPPSQIEAIAGLPNVIYVSRMQESTTWGNLKPRFMSRPQMSLRPGMEAKAASLKNYLASVLPLLSERSPRQAMSTNGVGSQTSEGDVTHKANTARSTYGVSGVGIKIGVLSNGVDNLAVSQAVGDLGPVTILPGQAGSGDEGTAMLEIVHDLAPSASLYYATALPTITQFAQNIKDLRAAGCDIIVDDVSYFVETRFQDGQDPAIVSTSNIGVVVQAVNDVVNSGAYYFSSAANSGNLDDATSGTWEGDFVDGGAGAGVLTGAGNVHLFAPGQTFDVLARGGNPVILEWADPIGGAANDYDLYILDAAGANIVAASASAQDGTQDAWEGVGTSSAWVNYQIVIVLYSGSPRFLHLSTNRGTLSIATSGATYGHNAARLAYGVAATPAHLQFTTGYPVGPYPNPFSATNLVEKFTSDGPRRIFFSADGTPITPGNFSSTGGTALNKPDITAADGVAITGAGIFPNPFYGTSAAAPHAAAIAALVKSARPDIDATGMRNALAGASIDILASGWDRNSGQGITMADSALAAAGTTPGANLEMGDVVATENFGTGNGIIDPGEGVHLIVPLHNKFGAGNATNIKATLSTATTGVFIPTPAFVNYPNINAGAGPVNGTFNFTLASDFPPCASSVDFTLTIESTGGPSPRTINFSVPVGPAPLTITNNLGTVATVPTGFTAATGNQTSRIFRDGLATSCATTPKVFPGTSGTGTRAFDSYSFTACRDTCALVFLNAPGIGTNLFTSIYSPSLDPANIGTGYVGDAGSSSAAATFSAQLTAGTNYSVIVNEVNQGVAVGANYSLTLPGCAVRCAPANALPIAQAHDVTVTAPVSGTVNASVDNGSSDPDGDAITLTQSPAGPYPGGNTAVILTVTDTKGAQAQASATVHVMLTPTVTVTTSAATVLPGANVTFTATVGATGNGTTPTGTVQFKDGANNLGGAINLDGTGKATFTTNTLSPGAHTITATYSGNTQYVAATSANLAQNIGQYDFSVTANPASITIPRGKTGMATITVTPIGTYVGSVTLSCGSLPANTSCTFTPSTLSPTTSAVTSTVVISTMPGAATSGTRSAALLSTLSFGMLGVILFPLGRSKASKKTILVIATLLLMSFVIGFAACGTNTNPLDGVATAPGTYNIPMTVTGSASSHSATLSITVTVVK